MTECMAAGGCLAETLRARIAKLEAEVEDLKEQIASLERHD